MQSFKRNIRVGQVVMMANQISNFLTAMSQFKGLTLPEKTIYSAKALFGNVEGTEPVYTADDDDIVKSMMMALADKVSIEIFKASQNKEVFRTLDDGFVPFENPMEEVMANYGYRELLEEIAPDLV